MVMVRAVDLATAVISAQESAAEVETWSMGPVGSVTTSAAGCAKETMIVVEGSPGHSQENVTENEGVSAPLRATTTVLIAAMAVVVVVALVATQTIIVVAFTVTVEVVV